MEKLRECPLCGAKANEPENITPTKRPTWHIGCSQYCIGLNRSSKKESIKSWNTRHEPKHETVEYWKQEAIENLSIIEALKNCLNCENYISCMTKKAMMCKLNLKPKNLKHWKMKNTKHLDGLANQHGNPDSIGERV